MGDTRATIQADALDSAVVRDGLRTLDATVLVPDAVVATVDIAFTGAHPDGPVTLRTGGMLVYAAPSMRLSGRV